MIATPTEPSAETSRIPEHLIAPLDERERASVLDAVFAKLDADEVAPVVSMPSRRPGSGRLVGVVAVVLAIAAALVLWIGRPTTQVGPTLPEYALTELRGGISAVRSDPSDLDRVVELRAADRIGLVMTPAQATAVPVAVWMVARGEGKPDVMVSVDAEISPSGAVRISGALEKFVTLEPGAWEIWVVVAPAASAPADAQTAMTGAGMQRAGFRVKLLPAA